MSVEAYNAVWKYFEGTSGQRVLMLALANRADEHGICWPSVRELMAKTRLSRSGVYDCLAEIRKSGQLEIVEAGGGRGNVTLRWLKLPGLDGDTSDAERRLEKGPRGRTRRGDAKGPNAGPSGKEKVQHQGLGTESKGSGSLDTKGPNTGRPYIEETSVEPSGVESPEASPPSSQPDASSSSLPASVSEQQSVVDLPTGGRLSNLLADLLAANDPDRVRPRISKKWIDAERLLITADGRDPDVAARLIRWCQGDEFWRGNIKSMPKFRAKYSTLYDHARRSSGRRRGADAASDRIKERLRSAA